MIPLYFISRETSAALSLDMEPKGEREKHVARKINAFLLSTMLYWISDPHFSKQVTTP